MDCEIHHNLSGQLLIILGNGAVANELKGQKE